MQVNTEPSTRPEGHGDAGAAAAGDAARRHTVSAGDAEKAAALRKMKLLALSLLVLMAVIFVVAFALQKQYPWLEYVRAAAEGGMVGALADWFAVTALFKYPMGLKIPHTAIIPAAQGPDRRLAGRIRGDQLPLRAGGPGKAGLR